MRIVSGPGQCSRLENPISWNDVGPAGPRGEQGPAGPAGAIGVNCEVGQVLAQTGTGWQCSYITPLPSAIGLCGSGGCIISGCTPGEADCDGVVSNGCETNILDDTLNCGACGAECSALLSPPSYCTAGVCVPGCIDPGSTVCGSQCVYLQSDPANCGACGVVCSGATPNCCAGQCTLLCD